MIGCQMSNNTTPPTAAPPPPMPPIHQIGLLNQQVSRSKSLNDISDDSQISAFASDRFINNLAHNNGIPSSNHRATTLEDTWNHQTYMPIHDHNQYYSRHSDDIEFIHHQPNNVMINQNYNNLITSPSNNNANSNNIGFGNSSFDNSWNLNINQCSNKPSAGNVFNICNPLAINLNGVTEQIGNLHL